MSLALLACVGCSLLDLGGLQSEGPTANGGTGDLGGGGAGASPLGGSAGTGNTAGGAGGAGAGGGTGGTLGYCAGLARPPVFCADFDTANLVSDGWTGVAAGPFASYELDASTFVSAEQSAHVWLTPGAPDCSYAQLQRTISTSPTRFSLGFDVRPDDGALPAYLASVTYDIEPDHCRIVAYVQDTVTTLILQLFSNDVLSGSDSVAFNLETPASGDWSRVDLSIELVPEGGGAPGFKVAWNGSPLLDESLSDATPWLPCAAAPDPTTLEISLGPYCHDGGLEQSAHFDNVVFDELP